MRAVGVVRGFTWLFGFACAACALCVACASQQGAAGGNLPPKHPPPVVQVSARVQPLDPHATTFRSKFRAGEDAYLVVGLIDVNGQLRILFPDYPDSVGLVHADTTFFTREIYVGRAWRMPPYWFRYRSFDVVRDSYNATPTIGFAHDSDANADIAFLFAISSRFPLELSLLDSGTAWIGVDLSDDVYYRDPREAVYDLARTIGVHGPNSVTFATSRTERQASNW